MAKSKGAGSVYQRKSNKKWRAQFYVDGKRITKGGFDTKQEALEWKRREMFKYDQGYDPNAGKITLEEYLRLWFENHKAGLKPRTIYQYRRVMENYLIRYLGDVRLNQLTATRIAAHYQDLERKGIGLRSIELSHAVLHVALKGAIRDGYLKDNPASVVKVPRREPTEKEVWNQREVQQFLMTAGISPYYALYRLALTTGMRQGELLGVRWSDLSWNTGTLQIKQQVAQIRGEGWDFVSPKSQSSRRSIKVKGRTLAVLREQKEYVRELRKQAGDQWQEHDLVFPSSVGTPINPSNLRRDHKKLMDHADVKRIRFHDMRHTAASLMLNNDIAPIIVSKILGHSRPSTTMNIYGHLIPGMQDEAAHLMDELTALHSVDFSKKDPDVDESGGDEEGEKGVEEGYPHQFTPINR